LLALEPDGAAPGAAPCSDCGATAGGSSAPTSIGVAYLLNRSTEVAIEDRDPQIYEKRMERLGFGGRM